MVHPAPNWKLGTHVRPCFRVFERYNIVDERDLHTAADRLFQHLNGKNGNGSHL
jgi:hypothetical protein